MLQQRHINGKLFQRVKQREGHSYSYKFTTDNGIEYEAEFWYSPLDGKKGKLLYLFEFAPSDAFDGGDDG